MLVFESPEESTFEDLLLSIIDCKNVVSLPSEWYNTQLTGKGFHMRMWQVIRQTKLLFIVYTVTPDKLAFGKTGGARTKS